MVWSNPRAELPEEAVENQVLIPDAQEHGYHGIVPDLEDNEAYTLAGAVKAQDTERKERQKRETEFAKNDPANKADEPRKPAPRRPSRAKEDS